MIQRWLIAVTFLAFGVSSAPAQERKPIVPFEGTQAFQHILRLLRLEPVRALDECVDLRPEDTVMILFGKLDVLDDLTERGWRLRSFLRAGGSILVASDYPDEGRLAVLAAGIKGSVVEARPDRAFNRITQCPLITLKEVDEPDHPIFKNVKTIATNRPSYLAWEESSRFVRLLKFPAESRSGGWSIPLSPFAVGSPAHVKPQQGRVLVFAGHGQFVNAMMAQNTVDNFVFAWNCIAWLREKENGQRKHALFIESGKIRTDFNIPLAELPPIPIPPTRVINAVLRGIEEENLFNQVLHDNVEPEQILQGVMIFLSAILVFVVARSLFKARYRLDTAAPLVAPSLEAAIRDVPVLSQRHRALLLQGNLFEAAQMLAQLWFDKHAPEQEVMPGVRIDAGFWQRWRLDRQVRTLWDVAHGPPREISRGEFQKLMDSVEQLTDAYHRGVLRFELGQRRT